MLECSNIYYNLSQIALVVSRWITSIWTSGSSDGEITVMAWAYQLSKNHEWLDVEAVQMKTSLWIPHWRQSPHQGAVYHQCGRVARGHKRSCELSLPRSYNCHHLVSHPLLCKTYGRNDGVVLQYYQTTQMLYHSTVNPTAAQTDSWMTIL